MIIYCLLSGGLDSTVVLAKAVASVPAGGTVHAVSINYGQRHSRELISAMRVADAYGVTHEVLPVPIPTTLLNDPSVPVPDFSYSDIQGVSPTYVPFRNGLMLAALTAYIVGQHVDPLAPSPAPDEIQIHWGAHAEDAQGWAYPDCTLEFVGAMANAIYVGTYHKIRLVAPFISMMKHEIVAEGHRLGVPFEDTWSCYRGGDVHCGTCATCRARHEAFEKAGIPDPTDYVA